MSRATQSATSTAALPKVHATVVAMLAEAAVALAPGRVVTSLQDVRLSRWLAFDDEPSRATAERILRDLFGDAYVTDMEPSALPRELMRMKDEVESGSETLESKLRYLLWIN